MVKVVFTYHFFDSWDPSQGEYGFGAFATSNTPALDNNGNFQIGWAFSPKPYVDFSGAGYNPTNYGVPDWNIRPEMVSQDSDNTFWVIFGSNLTDGPPDENYGISNIEIWVK